MTSIIILSYNTRDMLEFCLNSIRLYTELGTYEIIVVDNASTDGSAEYLRQQDDVRTIFNTENMGFPKGCNQGLEIARGDDLLLLNSDTIVTPRWLEQLKNCLYASEKHGAVSCVTNSCSNHQNIAVTYTWPDVDALFDFGDRFNHPNPDIWQRRLKLVGFCFLFKREIYEKIGGLDERFSPGNYEDDDYSLRIWQAGYECILARDTFIHHFGSASFKKKKAADDDFVRRYNSLLEGNRKKFLEKHGIGEQWGNIGNSVYFGIADIPEGARVFVADCHCGEALFYLENKPLTVSAVTGNRQELAIARAAGFQAEYCQNFLEDMERCVPFDLDAIMVSDEYRLTTENIAALQRHLNQGGIVLHVADTPNGRAIIKSRLPNYRSELDENLICFISAVNDIDMYNNICLAAIKKLRVPEGMRVETVVIEGAKSMTEACQAGMEASDAKYKIYIHQDTEILSEDFLEVMVREFKKHPNFGIAGVVGSKSIDAYGRWWETSKEYFAGGIIDNTRIKGVYETRTYCVDANESIEVRMLDGVVLMTQYDVPWRKDIFDGWHFYDASQVQEFRRQNLHAMVLPGIKPWVKHYCGILLLPGTKAEKEYIAAQVKFTREYGVF